MKDRQQNNIHLFLCSVWVSTDKEVLGLQRSPFSVPAVTFGDVLSGSPQENKNGTITSVKTHISTRGLKDHDTGSLTKVATLKSKAHQPFQHMQLAFLLSHVFLSKRVLP